MATWEAHGGVYWDRLGSVDSRRKMVLAVFVVVRTGDRDLGIPVRARGGYPDSPVGCCVVSSGNQPGESRPHAV